MTGEPVMVSAQGEPRAGKSTIDKAGLGSRTRHKSAGISLLWVAFLLTGCATTPPGNPDNICDIFDDKPGWYAHAQRAQKKWQSPIPIMMSIMYQESGFVHNARPPRRKILWLVPGPRKSSAAGYAQAKVETWKEYERSSGNAWARRDRFKDAIDFIGWYNHQSTRRSSINSRDSYHLYLAYHEGHGGFNRGSYRSKQWLQTTARQVANRSDRYAAQLAKCEKRFQRSWWWPF